MTPKEAIAIKLALAGLKQKLGGLSGVVTNPLTQQAIRYWWASIPMGLALWGLYKERKESGKKLRLHHVFMDISTVAIPVVAIASLVSLAKGKDQP